MIRSIPPRIIAFGRGRDAVLLHLRQSRTRRAKNELRGGKAICGDGEERTRSRVNETKMRARDMRLMAGRNAMRLMRPAER